MKFTSKNPGDARHITWRSPAGDNRRPHTVEYMGGVCERVVVI